MTERQCITDIRRKLTPDDNGPTRVTDITTEKQQLTKMSYGQSVTIAEKEYLGQVMSEEECTIIVQHPDDMIRNDRCGNMTFNSRTSCHTTSLSKEKVAKINQ